MVPSSSRIGSEVGHGSPDPTLNICMIRICKINLWGRTDSSTLVYVLCVRGNTHVHLRKSSKYDAVARLLANDIISITFKFESSNAVFNICGIEMSGSVVSRVPSGK